MMKSKVERMLYSRRIKGLKENKLDLRNRSLDIYFSFMYFVFMAQQAEMLQHFQVSFLNSITLLRSAISVDEPGLVIGTELVARC